MAYFTQAVIADDAYMRLRVAQAAAQEGCAVDAGIDPDEWTLEWRRVWSSSPGWDTTWEGSASTEKGREAITDGQILSQVQSMMPFMHVIAHRLTLTPSDEAARSYVDMKAESTGHLIDQLRLAVERTLGEPLK